MWFDGIFIRRSGTGIKRTISMSNTIKITARRKKRMENGIRADRIGSKPHSNGDSFSRLDEYDFIEVRTEIKYTNGGMTMAMIEDIVVRSIN